MNKKETKKVDSDFSKILEKILKSDERFVDQDGDLLKSEVVDKAQKIDIKLIELLLSDATIKKIFFIEIKKHWIFDINKFVDFIQLKEFLPDSYTKYRNKVGLQIDGKFMKAKGEVALVWPYKDCVLEGGQTKEEQKRGEIFFNEILAQDEITKLFNPKVITNWQKWVLDKKTKKIKGEKVQEIRRDETGTIKENMIIKGNNLLALHTLKKQFSEKIKLIYIDPPYNTGNDSFGYNDRFNHSTWLTFMKNRLEVARELLRDDGVIFVQCDDNEQAYLKILMDEIFGRDNFISTLVRKIIEGGKQDSKFIQNIHDYIFIYSKNIETSKLNRKKQEDFEHYNKKDKYFKTRGFYYLKPLFTKGLGYVKSLDYPINYNNKAISPNVDNKKEYRWIWSKARVLKAIQAGFIEFIENKKGEIKVYYKTYRFVDTKNNELERSNPYTSLMVDGFGNRQSQIESTNIFNSKLFDFPKPEKLLMEIINMSTKDDDIILDFFAGSGTTLAVAHKIGRQYIGIEQMDYIHDLPESRLKKVIEGEQGGISKAVKWKGGGDFIYCELARWNENFVDKIQKAKNTKELVKIWNEMKNPRVSFLNWNVDLKKQDATMEDFKKLPFNKQQDVLVELLDKNQLYVNLPEMEDEDHKISKEDIKLNKEFYEI